MQPTHPLIKAPRRRVLAQHPDDHRAETAVGELLRCGFEERAADAASVVLRQYIDGVDLALEPLLGRSRTSADAETDDRAVVLCDEGELMRRQRGHERASSCGVVAESTQD